MDMNKELEIETIENVGRVLDNIFSEETNQDSKDFFQGEIEQINNNNNNQNFIEYPNVKSAPKLFVNDQLFVQSETNLSPPYSVMDQMLRQGEACSVRRPLAPKRCQL